MRLSSAMNMPMRIFCAHAVIACVWRRGLVFCCFLLWYMCAEQGRERESLHWRNGERMSLTCGKGEAFSEYFWTMHNFVPQRRNGSAFDTKLVKNIYITVFIRAARRFYASFQKGRDTQTAVRTKQVNNCLFFSLPLSRRLWWCSIFLVIILKTVVSRSLSKFREGVALPSELRLFFAASQKGGIIVGLWEKVDNVYACVCVCVVHV